MTVLTPTLIVMQWAAAIAILLFGVALGWNWRGAQARKTLPGGMGTSDSFNTTFKALGWIARGRPKPDTQDLDQLRVQLAGCLTAAEGRAGDSPPTQGNWAWSPAFEAVMHLRAAYDQLRASDLGTMGAPALVGNSRRAETSVQRKTATAVFHSDGYPMPVRKAWGDVPYDELGPMFLDQFLLRYFSDLMPSLIPRNDGVMLWWLREDSYEFDGRDPWASFLAACSWAKEMPLLFEQLTGYKLNELQLNNAIAEYVRRLQKSSKVSV